ncbi:bifunctional phosphoribosylaminoimidazolecarboxamide formyltransferase/inosine monophosphate cyclohydrolase [Schaalia sp. 19OD2882]|uniref:bifunctional phosphoribosylaminoimidazolecarboxamide formyltransferase/inosine monophosphate cyclohydrolase n=1 Tax=Schaalia sp. 19OD2882 TaxID=2794089 RepID=UPI001C1EF7F7|nr:bifunctional phosphoribosylaminoimidazolecarboxamide formyltransferase/inosine monophosphate cyclohydrolase [Schaalia sp. 19OD2882]QWW20027.1 bifunctional phosphoribosylaminoimidazolecarboxamide formyltransferase/inosine monophosphate cyclohydrolase [Schaalia sp. 19OD2882]
MSVRLDNLEPVDIRPIRRALISVHDKTGLEEFAAGLHEAGVQIVSTGSTAERIAAAGVPVTPVGDLTGFPEVLEGRVKTLHPKVHAGILADQRKADHRQQLTDLDIEAFDLVVCNLYPFKATVDSGAEFDECVEQIDIGGPSMVRAAAKNHPSVAVVTSPDRYDEVAEAAKGEGLCLAVRQNLAAEAFLHTATYDMAIAGWFAKELGREDLLEEFDDACAEQLGVEDDLFTQMLQGVFGASDGDQEPEGRWGEGVVIDATFGDLPLRVGERSGQGEGVDEDEGGAAFPELVSDVFERLEILRYGENPHQGAAVYGEFAEIDEEESWEGREGEPEKPMGPGVAHALLLNGKPMSFNNYTDGDAALRAAYDHERPCVAIIKHANPCGIAVADDIAEAHRKAHACDPVSAFGGVIAVNREVSEELARQIVPIFTEVVIAPAYAPEALEVLRSKKNLRVLLVTPPERSGYEFKQVSGGFLVQECDGVDAEGDSAETWTLAAGSPADAATLADLEFAWRSVRAVRSNAILVARDGASVGVGMGQVNRVDSCKLAVERANTLGGRSTGDAGASAIDSAGGARAEDVLAAAPERRTEGAVAASDAFFPFADGLQVLIDAGVKAVVQPGGSVRDQESIDAANAAGITMYFTGVRHFAH